MKRAWSFALVSLLSACAPRTGPDLPSAVAATTSAPVPLATPSPGGASRASGQEKTRPGDADPLAPPAFIEGRVVGEPRLAPATAKLLVATGVRLEQLTTVQTLAADLDGAAPDEQIVAAELYADGVHRASALWVFGGSGDARRVLATRMWEVSDAEQGYFESETGIRELAATRVGAPERPALRVSVVTMQGGHDPRYLRDTLYLIELRGERLETLFACARSESVVSGPERAGIAIERQIHFDGPPLHTLRVIRRIAIDPGVREDEDPTHHAAPPRQAEGRYELLDGRYAPVGKDVCQTQ